MKRILVPTDFSAYAKKALDYAVCLARKTGAEIILLHACELIHSPFEDRKVMINEHNLSIETNAYSQLQAMKESIERMDELLVTTRIYDGDVIESILETAENYRTDLVVMGTLGRTGLKSRIMGSKTAALLSRSEVPVITIPHAFEWSVPERILLALNDPKEDVALLKPAFVIAKLFGAEVTAAIFTGSGEDAVEFMEHSRAINAMQHQLQKVYSPTLVKTVHLSGNDFQEALQQFICRNQIHLLTMITHRRSTVQSLFNKSMTRQMSYHTTVPLLSVRAHLQQV
ncbi:MAG: universal stress protein [Flavisolibacter sp.]|nr:universal stress protein [Flavisolibacter sp.]MBD0374845.1 universal stress protein [Flavisolibacter sp.]